MRLTRPGVGLCSVVIGVMDEGEVTLRCALACHLARRPRWVNITLPGHTERRAAVGLTVTETQQRYGCECRWRTTWPKSPKHPKQCKNVLPVDDAGFALPA
jgi:hypothetical protein